ncbi:SH3 domain-containing protein [Adhaeribacter swui]|uniref:SH3 domain-containing protein n=1 Tax=Adhaeribacter swui TaxID=2086471 RepID=A0A7G7GDI0_9BACT|nr:SH3 domain-containing protein [Adhaeribacter swui]QNF35214.1 SH3 domain-containing protein [Adhaeribacter swui]
MKKLILSFVLFVQLGFAMAKDNKPTMVVQVKNDNVKMFQQAGTSTPILYAISTNDRVEIIRKWNTYWTMVKVNDKVGYVLHSELTYLKEKPEPRAIAKR